ncbi:MAG: hypothetical protein ACU0A2_05980 [Cognatishimia sp.]|uniref:hypothetical protein n=1 Tax=Cognatishimia sp. TaxID=2211648 RepID=UPI00405820DC
MEFQFTPKSVLGQVRTTPTFGRTPAEHAPGTPAASDAETSLKTYLDMPGQEPDSPPEDLAAWHSPKEAQAILAQVHIHLDDRAIRRYCAKGSLTCTKTTNLQGQEQWAVEPASLEHLIVARSHPDNAPADAGHAPDDRRENPINSYPALSGYVPDMTGAKHEGEGDSPTPEVAPQTDMVEFLKEQIRKKDDQLATKDQQISAMLERDRETNILIRNLQQMMLPEGRSGADEDRQSPIDQRKGGAL